LKRFYIVFTVSFFAFTLLLSGCKKTQTSRIPFVPIDVYANINNPAYFDIQPIGGFMYYNGAGSKGLLIYRSSFETFKAYDRHSPHNPENGCVITIDSSLINVYDACSNSTWTMIDGSVISGASLFPLQEYQTEFDGTVLHIYN